MMYFLAYVVWLAASFLLGKFIARMLLRRTKLSESIIARWCLAIILLPVIFVVPVIDELVGKDQYEQLCKEAEEIKIYAAVPVGQELYEKNGKWKLSDMSLPHDERRRAEEFLNSIIRWDLGSDSSVDALAAIPIHYRDTKIFDIKSGRLLAEFRIYSTSGGWLSRAAFERAGFFVKPQCLPPLRGDINRMVMPFNKKDGDAK